MKSLKWAALTGGVAFAMFHILASPARAQTFATDTIYGSPGVNYTITYEVVTKNRQPLPSPPPVVDVQYSVNGAPFSDYLNSNSNGSFTLGPLGNNFTFTSSFQFSKNISSAQLEFNSTSTNLRLRKAYETPNPTDIPRLSFDAAIPGRYQVTELLSGVYDGPSIPSPIPTFTINARGPGLSVTNAPVQAVPTSVSQQLQLTFYLSAKQAGLIQVFTHSPFKYLTLVSETSFNTTVPGKIINPGQHNNL